MRKKIIFIVFWLSMLFLAIFAFINSDLLREAVGHYIVTFGYPALLILSILSDTFEQPVGPEIPGMMALIFGLNFYAVVLISFLGSMIGSLISFYFGRRFLTDAMSSFCSAKKNLNLCKMFEKHGKKVLTIAALTPVPYVASCWLAGSLKISLKDFFLFGIFPRFIRITLILTVFFLGFI